jgi:hypothetical protein
MGDRCEGIRLRRESSMFDVGDVVGMVGHADAQRDGVEDEATRRAKEGKGIICATAGSDFYRDARTRSFADDACAKVGASDRRLLPPLVEFLPFRSPARGAHVAGLSMSLSLYSHVTNPDVFILVTILESRAACGESPFYCPTPQDHKAQQYQILPCYSTCPSLRFARGKPGQVTTGPH